MSSTAAPRAAKVVEDPLSEALDSGTSRDASLIEVFLDGDDLKLTAPVGVEVPDYALLIRS